MATVLPTGVSVLSSDRIKRSNQYLGAVFVSLSGFALGVTLAWNSSAGDTLRNILNATSTEIGLVGGILNAGACSGVLVVPYILKYLNRTNAILLTLPIYLIGWVFICLADQKLWSLLCGRFVCGLAGGISCVLSPIFIGEIADRDTRNRLLTYFQLLINFGILYAFLTTYWLDEHDAIWRYSLVCAISCAPIVLVGFLHESPLYYLMQDNESAARQSLTWYRGEEHPEELEELKRLIKKKSAAIEVES